MSAERLLTARAVGGLLDVSPETVLRWTRRGLLPAVRLPSGAIRYDPAALDEWLSAHAVGRAGDVTQEVSATQGATRQVAAYDAPLSSGLSATQPPNSAVTTQED
jgi:predicted DNA-binding transcriptional regulator AlpA